MNELIISYLPNSSLFKVDYHLLENPNIWKKRMISDPTLHEQFFRYIEGAVLLDKPINLYAFHHLKKLDLAVAYTLKDADIKFLIQLEWLKLGTNNNITNEGLMYMKKLKYLHLGENQKINNYVFRYIPQLKVLKLGHNKKITPDGIKTLKLEEIEYDFS